MIVTQFENLGIESLRRPTLVVPGAGISEKGASDATIKNALMAAELINLQADDPMAHICNPNQIFLVGRGSNPDVSYGTTEARAMAEILTEHTKMVPEMYLDEKPHDTVGSFAEIGEVAINAGITDLIIVGTFGHNYRAQTMAKRTLRAAYGKYAPEVTRWRTDMEVNSLKVANEIALTGVYMALTLGVTDSETLEKRNKRYRDITNLPKRVLSASGRSASYN